MVRDGPQPTPLQRIQSRTGLHVSPRALCAIAKSADHRGPPTPTHPHCVIAGSRAGPPCDCQTRVVRVRVSYTSSTFLTSGTGWDMGHRKVQPW